MYEGELTMASPEGCADPNCSCSEIMYNFIPNSHTYMQQNYKQKYIKLSQKKFSVKEKYWGGWARWE
jgi:hypothetical protein